jgi:hypothetical protein
MEHDNNYGHSSGRPCQPDKYFGQRGFLLLGNWLFSVNQYFILTDILENKQASYVSTLLHALVLLWFCSNYESWDTSTPLASLTLHASMKQYFAPPNEDCHLQDEWANLRQQGSVFELEYVSILTALAM